MRIAMVAADPLPPGCRARLEARTLAAAGHVVTLTGTMTDGAEPEEDDGDAVIVRMRPERFERPRPGVRGMLDAARALGRCGPIVEAAMSRDRPQVLHAIGGEVWQPALDAAREFGVPLVVEDGLEQIGDTGDGDETSRSTFLRGALAGLRSRAAAAERAARKSAAAAISPSDAMADDAFRRFGGERPVVVRTCPSYLPSKPTNALRVKLGVPPEDRIIVFHGPPDSAHGVEVAIRALRVLGERVMLVVLGANWCQDRLFALAAEEGVLPQVRITAAQQGAERMRLLASAEAAVLPLAGSDRRARLSLPASLVECLHAGLPVVVPDVAESGALVRRLGAGIVVPSGPEAHPNDIAEGVRTILADPFLRDACSAAALAATRDELRWERESERLIDLYDRLGAAS